MEKPKTSQTAQALQSAAAYSGLELEDLELLSSSLGIFYESAKQKFRELEGMARKAKKLK
jgi:hypothetical protein